MTSRDAKRAAQQLFPLLERKKHEVSGAEGHDTAWSVLSGLDTALAIYAINA